MEKKSIYKKARRLNFSILENGKEFKRKTLSKQKNRKKISEYGLQLNEKQKVANLYIVREKQFRRLFLEARKNKNISTGLSLFRIFEKMLSNIVFRSGFARTRKEARQLINHKHILVNNKKVNCPSYLCKINDIISVSDKIKDVIKERIKEIKTFFPTIKVDKENVSCCFTREPERNELSKDIDENLIIEWYNRRI